MPRTYLKPDVGGTGTSVIAAHSYDETGGEDANLWKCMGS